MWTYRENEILSPVLQPSKPIPEQAPCKRESPPPGLPSVPPPKRRCKPQPSSNTFILIGAIYLCGLLFGAVCNSFLSEGILEYTRYFAQSNLEFYKSADKTLIFCSGFLSFFLQLTVIFLLGLCAFGKFAIPIMLFAKGAGFGAFIADTFAEMGLFAGFTAQLVMFWLPEFIISIEIFLLSKHALQQSSLLWSVFIGRHNPVILGQKPRRFFNLYLVLCLFAFIPAALSSFLVMHFGKICGL